LLRHLLLTTEALAKVGPPPLKLLRVKGDRREGMEIIVDANNQLTYDLKVI